jgi:hypothetical protein
VAREVVREYYTAEQAGALFGVVLASDGSVDHVSTEKLRGKMIAARGR